MSSCFAGDDRAITSSSEVTRARKQRAIYKAMQTSVRRGEKSRSAYLGWNRNYRLKAPNQLPTTSPSADCLASSHSYDDFMNIVRGRLLVDPKLEVPPGVGTWLPSLLTRAVAADEPQMMQKLADTPTADNKKTWTLPYIRDVLERPPNGEDFTTYVHTGYPPNLTDPAYKLYKGNCQKPLTLASIAERNSYVVTPIDASSYRYYQLAMTQPTSGIKFPSTVSFNQLSQGEKCCNACGEGRGTWKYPKACATCCFAEANNVLTFLPLKHNMIQTVKNYKPCASELCPGTDPGKKSNPHV